MAKKSIIKNFIKDKITRSNPASILKGSKAWEDTVTYIAPAVAGYALTRTAGRLARNFIGPKINYKWVKPLSIAANIAALAGIWYASGKIQSLRRYRDGAIAGSGVAVLQAAIEAIMPKLAWIFDPATKSLGGSSVSEHQELNLGEDDSMAVGDDIDVIDGEPSSDYNEGIFAN